MSRKQKTFAPLQIKFQKAIADWPNIPKDDYACADQIINDFNDILFLAARRPIEDQYHLGILRAAAKHLLEYENESLPDGLEDAIVAVMAESIENAESPLHAALLALVRHRAQQSGTAL